VASTTYVTSRITPLGVLGWRVAAGAGVGLLLFALLWLARGLLVTERAPRSTLPAGASGDWFGRLCFTLLAPVALYFSPLVHLPFLDLGLLGDAGSHPDVHNVFALGLAPILSAFLLVALIVPRWRRLRTHDRARLARAIAVVALALALTQSWFYAVWLEPYLATT